jgi:DNA adenine methylase
MTPIIEPTRPALRWHGGKWMLAPWIIAHFPAHRIYVEPFGGAASVLIRKARSHAEVYGDLDDELVTLFRVLQNPDDGARLIAALMVTPYSRAEFDMAYEISECRIENSRRLIVRSFMGFGSDGATRHSKTGFRGDSNRSGCTPARDFSNYPPALRAIVERLRGVVIECRPALQVMASHDSPDTLHYVDPPYLPETRGGRSGEVRHAYRYELSDADHCELLEAIDALKGFVILSGYPAPLYERYLGHWHRVEREALADGCQTAHRGAVDQPGRRRCAGTGGGALSPARHARRCAMMRDPSAHAATVPARSADQHGANVARIARVRVTLPLALAA